MKNLILIIFFSSFLSLVWSQSGVEVTTNSKISEVTIQNSFDRISVNAYNIQAQSKVDELIEYLKIAQNPANSEELNAQLKSNVQQLFITDETLLIKQFESNEFSSNPENWMESLKQSKVKIISADLLNTEMKNSYWIYTYEFRYEVNGKSKKQKVKIQVFFKPQTKNFGSKRKAVWDLKLGNVIFLE